MPRNGAALLLPRLRPRLGQRRLAEMPWTRRIAALSPVVSREDLADEPGPQPGLRFGTRDRHRQFMAKPPMTCDYETIRKHPKLPRDPTQLAKLVVDIATASAKDVHDSDTSPMSAVRRAGGLRGGRARAKKLPKERRAETAKQADAARWRNDDG
jgi:hypothetical protein